MHKHSWRLLIGILVLVGYQADAQTLLWARQFDSPPAAAFQIAADSSGVYIAGITYKALPGQTKVTISGSQADGFLRKYDPSGNVLWTREFAVNNPATPQVPFPLSVNGVAVDSTGVYVAGKAVQGGGNRYEASSGSLALVFKFDMNGNLLWTHQTTTSKTVSGESATGIALNGGAVYVVGLAAVFINSGHSITTKAYLRKLDPSSGTELWTTQFANNSGSTNAPIPYGVAADASGTYIVGSTNGSLTSQPFATGQDLFIRKYDSNGNALWTSQFGTMFGPEYAYAVSAGASGVYVVGSTPGLLGIQTLPTFDYDAYVRKYDTSGNLQWTQQFGTIDREQAFGALADDTGMYVVGYTRSVLGAASLGGEDAFLRRYDSNGNALWTLQTGSVDDDYAFGVATDGGAIYIGGYTDRNSVPRTLNSTLGVTNLADPFLYKYSPPAPGGPVVGAIVNNASFATSPQPVAPGSIAAIFGTGLNDGSQVLTSAFGSDGKLVTTLGGASVTVGDVPAPMFYSTSAQLGIQIPLDLAGQTSASVQVTVGGKTSVVQSVNLSSVKPGLFTVSQDGKGAAVCLHTDGVTPVTTDNPAHPGEVVIFYGTGFGPVSPSIDTGAPSSGNQTVSTPIVTIDGLSAEVQFSGIAPGFVGLNQINVVVPGLARTNAADPVVLTVNGVAANQVTVPVGPQ
jgi:uncharacterized protein (TIGR03437 family)